MSESNGKTTLSFSERVARAKLEAEAKAKQPAEASASSAELIESSRIASSDDKTVYFHSSIASFRFLVGPGRKADFKDYFFITNNPVEIETVRRDFVKKLSGHVKVTEVSPYFYQAARMIQPEILPLPDQKDLTLEQQEQKLDNS